jgi:hypothetical protein
METTATAAQKGERTQSPLLPRRGDLQRPRIAATGPPRHIPANRRCCNPPTATPRRGTSQRGQRRASRPREGSAKGSGACGACLSDRRPPVNSSSKTPIVRAQRASAARNAAAKDRRLISRASVTARQPVIPRSSRRPASVPPPMESSAIGKSSERAARSGRDMGTVAGLPTGLSKIRTPGHSRARDRAVEGNPEGEGMRRHS